MITHVLDSAAAGAEGRAVLGTPEHVSNGKALEELRSALLLVHPKAGEEHNQRRTDAAEALIKARTEMLAAHGRAIRAAEEARAGREQACAAAENEWEKARERAPVPPTKRSLLSMRRRGRPRMQRSRRHGGWKMRSAQRRRTRAHTAGCLN